MFENSSQIVSFLKEKFGENTSPQYHIVEILDSSLMEERNSRRRMKFPTITGSSDWHVLIFTPNASEFKASPRLCMCDQCLVTYGSCSLFQSYAVRVETINVPTLRNDVLPPPEILGEEEVIEFVNEGTFVAVAAPKSTDTVWVVDPFWIIKVTKVNRIDTDNESVDSYGFKIAPKVMHLEGNFLEKNERLTTSKKIGYDLSKKVTFFFKESILYPYVNITEGKRGLFLNMTDYTDILYHIENNGYAHL